MEIFLLSLFGIIAGILGGMGMGGGTILIPMLVLFCSVNQHVAQSVNLAAFIPMCIICLIIHFKNKLIDIKAALIVGIPASILGIIGSIVALSLPQNSLRLYFGIFLLVLGVYQLIYAITQIIKKEKQIDK